MKTKKIISILTALTLAAAMTGCTQTQDSSKSSSSVGSKTDESSISSSGVKEDSSVEGEAPITNDMAPTDTGEAVPKSAYEGTADGKRSYSAEAATDSARGADTKSPAMSPSADKGFTEVAPDEAAGAPDAADMPLVDVAPETESPTESHSSALEPGSVELIGPEISKPVESDPEETEPIISEPEESETIVSEPEVSVLPEAGKLTAGEWNDNENWGFFMNLVNSDKIQFPCFGIDPRYRVELTVKNEKGEPVPNANAELFDDNGHKSLWKAVTDKNGKAYLFAQETTQKASAVVTSGNESTIVETFSLSSGNNDGQGRSTANGKSFDVKLNSEPVTYKATDIMFIMDATDSMSDEMMFLQSEFSAIASAAGTDNTKYSVNFYRDEGDDYVTRCYDFTDDVANVQKTLNAQVADGGGDMPEAVAQVLDECINKASWREDSVKIAFLIYDAPAHHDELEATLQKNIAAASEKGIRLIPVVSSGSDRETELFGRAAAIQTGGTYVFLTDDSGIGDSHLEPIIGEYKVEKLYDIILRVIGNYKQ